jgi:hypothetical protein
VNDEQFNRMARNLARMREMNITEEEANFMLGALSVAEEMEAALDLIADRRAGNVTKGMAS